MSPRAASNGHRWLGVAGSALLLLVGSVIPVPTRYNPEFGPYGPDRGLHLVGHAVLTAALVAALEDDGSSLPVAVTAVLSSTAYGVVTELLQEVIPGREFERGDVLAGLVGSLVGVLACRRFTRGNRSRC